MVAEIIILIAALLFFITGIALLNGKGAWLIAGYNTATEEERKKFDEKKMCRAVGFTCFVCAIMLLIMAYMGYRVDSGLMNESNMLPFGLIFVTVILSSIIISIVYINTKAKND